MQKGGTKVLIKILFQKLEGLRQKQNLNSNKNLNQEEEQKLIHNNSPTE